MGDISNELYDCRVNMPGEIYCLYDLAIWKNGLAFKKIDFSEKGIPVIKIAELNNGIGTSTAYTEGNYGDDVHLVKGDMLFSWSGNPQTSIDIFWFPLKEGWLNQHIFKVTAYENIILKEYLFYLMKSLKPVFTKIASNKQTTGLGHVTIADLKQIKVTIPSLELQKSIVSIIKPIDDKVSNNKAINRNLNEQIEAIFETMRSNKETNTVKVGELILTSNTGADAIQKAPIVEENTGVRCVRVGDMTNNRPVHEWGFSKVEPDVFNQYQLRKDDIIVTRTATLGINRLITKDLDAVYNNGLIRITLNKTKVNPLFLYRQFQLSDFSNYIARINGESSTRPNMKMNYLLDYEFEIPSIDEQHRIVDQIIDSYNLQQKLIDENIELVDIRDTLLPKLMSGELDVSGLEI